MKAAGAWQRLCLGHRLLGLGALLTNENEFNGEQLLPEPGPLQARGLSINSHPPKAPGWEFGEHAALALETRGGRLLEKQKL